MDTLKELLDSKTFNRRSYVAVIVWFALGVLLLGVFALIDAGAPRFSCSVQSKNMDNIREKCLEQYEERFNKSDIPVYAFVIVNLCVLAIVCGFYSQVVKSKVERLLGAENQRPPETRRLFGAYCCQLVARLFFAILFLVLQIRVLYPHNFPSDYNCKLTFAAGPHTANASVANIQNTTENIYECRNQRGKKDTAWMYAVIGMNGVFILFVLIEFICILSRLASKGLEFLEDLQFLKVHLNLTAPPQQEQNREETSPLQLQDQVQQNSRQDQNEQISSFIDSLKENITKAPLKITPHFEPKQGEGERTKLKFDDIYTKLVIIHNRAHHDYSRNREGNLFPIQNKNCQPLKNPEDVVDAEKKKILLIGRPGIGKTQLCTKFLRDWASGKLFKRFEIAFLIKLRRFNSKGKQRLNLRELLNSAEFSQTDLPDEVWKYILKNPEKVLILFDGVDEYKEHLSISNVNSNFLSRPEEEMPLHALYYKVAESELLREAAVLTTTRPTAVSSVTDLSFDNTFEILGFTPEQVENYVENFTKDAEKNLSGVGEKMKKHLRGNANLLSLCYIPVNCLIICSSLLREVRFKTEKGSDLNDVSLSAKLTQLYKKATRIFFFEHNDGYRHLSRKEIELDRLPSEVEEQGVQTTFKQLGELAYKGIDEGRLIFEKDEVRGLENCSLFHQMPDRRSSPHNSEEQFCFVHLTMQEFLAAKHITDTMNEAELRTFVKDHIKKGEWQVVLQFVAGLLGERDERLMKIFTDLLPEKTEEKEERQLMLMSPESEPRTFTCVPTDSEKHLALTIIKCIHEGSESNLVQSKLENIRCNALDFSDCSLAPADCTAIVHVFKHVQQISLINLYDNNIDSLGCAEIAKLFDNDNSQLTDLNLGFNRIGDEGVKQLSKGIKNSNLESLHLSANNITDKGLNYLSDKLVNTNVKSLDLRSNNITDKGLNYLSDKLVNTQVKSLYLSGNNITDKGLNYLSDKLVNTQVKSLYLSGNNITDIGLNYLSDKLVNTQVKSLDLSYNNITDKGLNYLSDKLVNTNLKLLNLSHNPNITREAKQRIQDANPNCKFIF